MTFINQLIVVYFIKTKCQISHDFLFHRYILNQLINFETIKIFKIIKLEYLFLKIMYFWILKRNQYIKQISITNNQFFIFMFVYFWTFWIFFLFHQTYNISKSILYTIIFLAFDGNIDKYQFLDKFQLIFLGVINTLVPSIGRIVAY